MVFIFYVFYQTRCLSLIIIDSEHELINWNTVKLCCNQLSGEAKNVHYKRF